MAQRIYWVPHTVCFLGCDHCHNDSLLAGQPMSRHVIDGVIAHLPGPESRYRLEEVLVGGGEALMRGQQMERLIRRFRERFPRGQQPTVAARRAAGHVILGLQTMGLPLADSQGQVSPKLIDYWLDLGIDLFHIASHDAFHERRRPDYPWETLRANLRAYGEAHDVEFVIYGKAPARLIPSGRVLHNLAALEGEGAALLTAEGYCASAWEGGANFLSGQERVHPDCSEVVIDPEGWVHACCWHELAPRLFDLSVTSFEQGMDRLQTEPLAQALDAGDIIGLAAIAGVAPEPAQRARAAVGECGLCRLCAARLAHQPEYAWLRAAALSIQEIKFYRQRLGEETMRLLAEPALRLARSGDDQA